MNKKLFMQSWYPRFGNCAFPTSFVWLRPEAIERLKSEEVAPPEEFDEVDKQVVEDLRQPMNHIPGGIFVSVDGLAPTDTERFAAKRGSVHSPESAWYNLRQSIKVRDAAIRGEVSCICLRPYRNMTLFREFRLFIKNRELIAMSQYHLVRHFHRLERAKERYWQEAKEFVAKNHWLFPEDDFAADIYFTSDDSIILLDLNPWGEPTSPLLLNKWERDWSSEIGIVTMAPPVAIKGDVDVSF